MTKLINNIEKLIVLYSGIFLVMLVLSNSTFLLYHRIASQLIEQFPSELGKYKLFLELKNDILIKIVVSKFELFEI